MPGIDIYLKRKIFSWTIKNSALRFYRLHVHEIETVKVFHLPNFSGFFWNTIILYKIWFYHNFNNMICHENIHFTNWYYMNFKVYISCSFCDIQLYNACISIADLPLSVKRNNLQIWKFHWFYYFLNIANYYLKLSYFSDFNKLNLGYTLM